MHIEPEKIIDAEQSLSGLYQGSVRVTAGATATITGTLQGSLSVESSSTAIIVGVQQGSVNIAQGCHVLVRGSLQGSVNVEYGATLENSPSGKLAGSLNVNGRVINYGIRGGPVAGSGEIIDKPGSSVKKPIKVSGMDMTDSNSS